jgi:pilus assembly protein Flp/PilA
MFRTVFRGRPVQRNESNSTQEEKVKMIRKFLKDESGATAIEYGLIAALVAVACIVALTAVGTSLRGLFETVDTKLKAANP